MRKYDNIHQETGSQTLEGTAGHDRQYREIMKYEKTKVSKKP